MSNTPFNFEQFEYLPLAYKARIADAYDTAHDFRKDLARMKPDEFKTKVDEYLKIATVEYWDFPIDLQSIRDIRHVLDLDDGINSIPF